MVHPTQSEQSAPVQEGDSFKDVVIASLSDDFVSPDTWFAASQLGNHHLHSVPRRQLARIQSATETGCST